MVRMKHTVGSYLSIAVPILHLVAAWRLADWKKWRKYYPTMLFAIVVDFFSTIISYRYSLWHFHARLFIPNHTITDFLIALVLLPSIVLIYLSRYPYESRLLVQAGYMALWAVIESLSEWCFFLTGMITYDHGWNFAWSVLLWTIMFPILRLHDYRPWLAFLVCAGLAAFVMGHFDIPVTDAK